VPRFRTRLLTGAIAAVALAGAAPAAAAPPPERSGIYGGGAVRGYVHFVSLRVLPDGGLNAHATLVTNCAPRFGDELTESISVRNAKLGDDGRYSATTTFSDVVDPGVPLTGGMVAEGTIAFSVEVAPRGVATGRVRVRTSYRDAHGGGELSSCDTGDIPWSARRPAANAGSGRTALQPGTHRGTTDQDEPFLMRVTRRGRLVRRAGLTVNVDCASAVGLPLDVVAQRMRVRRGRFAGEGGFRRPFTDRDGRELVERYSWKLNGRFGRRGARGSFEMSGIVRRRSDGQRVGSCTTGAVFWRASAR
jgi:hypothetical protein